MKLTALTAVFCNALGASIGSGKSAFAAGKPGQKVLDLPHRVEVLPNGLRVIAVKYPSPGAVSYQIPVRVGSRNEVEKGKSGFAHFFEHLMFRGTKNMSGREFGELFAKLGVENNAWTASDLTNYHGTVASVYLSKILAAEADRFQNLQFDEKALRDEAGAVVGEYNKSVARPEFLLEEKLSETAFRVHPYAHTTMGYKADILNFVERYPDVWPFFKRYYRPGNASVVLVGDLDPEKAVALVRKHFGGWKDPEFPGVEIPKEPKQAEPRRADLTLQKPTQTRLVVAYKVPAFTVEKSSSAALGLLAEMTFSTTSEFQKEYRFEKKWLDAVDASPQDSVDPGLWTISLRFSQAGEGKTDEVLKAVEAAIGKLRDTAPKFERLSATRKRVRNGMITGSFSSPEALAGRIAWYTSLVAAREPQSRPDLGVFDRYLSQIDAASPEVLQAFAREYLVDAGKTVVVLRGSSEQ